MEDFEGEDDLQNCCWVCLGAGTEAEPLQRVCSCPSLVHAKCLARWNLHCAGKAEETRCRFCNNKYPDWKQTLTAPAVRGVPQPAPVLSIFYANQYARIKVRPGPEGLITFKVELERILGRDINSVNLVFRCQCPETGRELYLHGLQAWSAAIHCACIRAARRAQTSSSRAAASSSGSSSSRGHLPPSTHSHPAGNGEQAQRSVSRSSPGIMSHEQATSTSSGPSSTAASTGGSTYASPVPSTITSVGQPYMLARSPASHAQPTAGVAAAAPIPAVHTCEHPSSLMYPPSSSPYLRPQVVATPTSQSGSSSGPEGPQLGGRLGPQQPYYPSHAMSQPPASAISAGAGSWQWQQGPAAGSGFLPPLHSLPAGGAPYQASAATTPSSQPDRSACVSPPLASLPSPTWPGQYGRSNSLPSHPGSPAAHTAAEQCDYMTPSSTPAPLHDISSTDSSYTSDLSVPSAVASLQALGRCHGSGPVASDGKGGTDAVHNAPPSPPASQYQVTRYHHKHRFVHQTSQQQDLAADAPRSAPVGLIDPDTCNLPVIPPFPLGRTSTPTSSNPSSSGSARGTLMRTAGNTCLSDYQCCTNEDVTGAHMTSGSFTTAHSSPANSPAVHAGAPGMKVRGPSGMSGTQTTTTNNTGGRMGSIQSLPPIGGGPQSAHGSSSSRNISTNTGVQDARAASIINRLRGFFRLRNTQHC